MEPTQCITWRKDDRRSTGMVAGMVCLALLSTPASAAPAVAPEVKAQAQASYGKLPLSFEVNQGQTDAQVKLLARGQGYTLFLTPTEAVLSLKKPQAKAEASPSSIRSSSAASETIGTVLRMRLIGANSAPKIVGREPLPGRVNYLIGKEPGKWHTQVPIYGKVAYEGVYPGVDLVYYGNQGQLEYDFVVSPGADPQQIELAFQGADNIGLNPAGELVLHAQKGDIRMHKPVIYQEIDGIRKPIDGGYVFKAGRTVGFQVSAYDTARPLIIDPILVYSTYLGGSDQDNSSSIAVDLQGRVYVAGFTRSSDFPVLNAPQSTIGGRYDAFVAQLTADGTALGYATYLGGSGDEDSAGIAVDLWGQATIVGDTSSSDFPTYNALQSALDGGLDGFVTQLTADGSALRYSTYLGGSRGDEVKDIAVDLWGQAIVTGHTDSSDFPAHNALQPTIGGRYDAFVAQFTADGRTLRYATYLGGNHDDFGDGIAVDLHGRAYVTGSTRSTNFPTVKSFQPVYGGGERDCFVAQLTADGTALGYATYLGGNHDDVGDGIAVDLQGRAYVTGSTRSTNFPIHNALQSASGGEIDGFVAQLTADGRALHYSTYLGGNEDDYGRDIAVDLQGRAYVTGGTRSTNFPTVKPFQPVYGGDGGDGFVAQFTADGRALRYASYLGGRYDDFGDGIAVDLHGWVYVAGTTLSSNLPTNNALQPVFGGSSDAFITKIRSDDLP